VRQQEKSHYLPDRVPQTPPAVAAAAARTVAAAATGPEDLRDLLTVLGLREPDPVPVAPPPTPPAAPAVDRTKPPPPPEPPAPCARGGHQKQWRWYKQKHRWVSTCETCRNEDRRLTYAEQRRREDHA
jgi:hypothetical protein